MNTYRYILERYRGLSTRYTCPQCGRKHTFTRYIDTENNNQYISDNVGKCNRLDKCGYHYTPKQYFTDNLHKRDRYLVVDGSLRPFTDNLWKRENRYECSFVRIHRENERKNANITNFLNFTNFLREFSEFREFSNTNNTQGCTTQFLRRRA